MSTGYNFGKSILVTDLPRLEKYGIRMIKREEMGSEYDESDKKDVQNGELIIFFDGKNYLRSYPLNNNIDEVTRFGGNDEEKILKAILVEFKVVAVNEHDTEAYGAPWIRQFQYFGEQGEKCPCCGKPK